MKNISPKGPVHVINETVELISNDNVILEIHSGTLWTTLENDGKEIGVAFSGQSRFAVDAITHTDAGAIGKSETPILRGIQVLLGRHELESASSVASDNNLANQDYTSEERFYDAILDRLHDWIRTESKVEISETGTVFFGYDIDEKSIVLVTKDDELVFTYGGHVTVLGDNQQVSVTKDEIAIGGEGGRTLTITKDGIDGLDALVDVGTIVRSATHGVRHGLKGLKGLKKLKHGRTAHWYGSHHHGKYHGAWESVDDFDWDD